jgi:hypothetical protein
VNSGAGLAMGDAGYPLPPFSVSVDSKGTLSLMILQVFIPEGLQTDFLQVFIVEELAIANGLGHRETEKVWGAG